MSDAEEAHRLFVAVMLERLEALGWEIEHSYDGYPNGDIEVFWPGPRTGQAMQFSGWWISWRPVEGKLAFGVGDDTMDRRWRQPLDADTTDPVAVANAADRAMHMLWHEDERDLRRELYAENRRLGQLRERVRELAHRMLVTPGQLRDALKSTEKEKQA
ncbi:hypothetical protein ABZX65_26740 [Streptomyces sp. NPDC003300]|uniref:hypothetical protein n=1 Tax=unclassified Streptomyces TaxID=2593676 RepID=UPI0033A8C86A